MIETTIVVVIVLAAAYFILRRLFRTVSGKQTCCDFSADNCRGCSLDESKTEAQGKSRSGK
jgi:FeoB-associated Cys-rich membrane protein